MQIYEIDKNDFLPLELEAEKVVSFGLIILIIKLIQMK